jgi:hypothetical protein
MRQKVEVAGGKWISRRPLLTTRAPADPTDPGDAADLSTPQGILLRKLANLRQFTDWHRRAATTTENEVSARLAKRKLLNC